MSETIEGQSQHDAIVNEENTTSANTTTNHRILRERGYVRERASEREKSISERERKEHPRERESIREREHPGGSCNSHPSGTSPRYLVKKMTGQLFQVLRKPYIRPQPINTLHNPGIRTFKYL
jgi:hypothetical protein